MTGLKERIERSGITFTWIAKKLGITREGLYNKLQGKSEFKASEIGVLIDVLQLTPSEQQRYFFTNECE
ncbi:DUF739 family protein [Veillonella magna]|uniref:DUF739 family protein n=1 Tax=Veillonella magna TaxID=464322 RepID=A0ABS2GGB9_9FIRM|nr:DUF739 family protein [Veillonella magna]MBM6824825.1 DUF739 family protein [Veillonella magna]MBM6913096.1 DUF739 family protein [Veillonella magna]